MAFAGGQPNIPVPPQDPEAEDPLAPPKILRSQLILQNFLKAQKLTRIYCMKQILCPEELPPLGRQGERNESLCRFNTS